MVLPVRARVPVPKVNKSVIDFLDIGFGKAERIAKLSKKEQHKRKYFVGIEQEKARTKIPSRQHNVKLMIGDAKARLSKIPSESVKVINFDFFPFVSIERNFEQNSPTRFSFHEEVKQTCPGLIQQVMRVLKKRGRFYITIPEGGISAIDTVLGVSGVLDYELFPVPYSKKNATKAMKYHFDLAKTDPSARPYRVVVVKK